MVRTLCVAILLGSIPVLLCAKVNPKIEQAVKGSFKAVDSIVPKRLILTRSQAEKIQYHAKARLETKLYRYYRFLSGEEVVGYGVLIARKVRTKKATVLYAFDPKGELRFAEIMAFGEPPEYIPNETWMGQFRSRDSDAPLQMGKDIPTISGATLSARSISDGARIARAILFDAVVR